MLKYKKMHLRKAYNVNLFFQGRGYGSSNVSKDTIAVVDNIGKKEITFCWIDAHAEEGALIVVDKKTMKETKRGGWEVTVGKEIPMEEAVKKIRSRWHEIPFDCKQAIAECFEIPHQVQEKKITVGIDLLPEESAEVNKLAVA